MRIISKFKDYYDFACAYGYDTTRTYVRKTEEITIDAKLNRGRMNYQAVGFCGIIYPFTNLLDDNLLVSKYDMSIRRETIIHGEACTCYRMKKEVSSNYFDEKLKAYTNKNKAILLKEIKENKQYNPKWAKRSKWGFSNLDEYDRIKNSKELLDIFEKYKVPVFYFLGNQQVILNPNLKKLLFHHVIEPHKAFQEIDMFLGRLFTMEVDDIHRTDNQIRNQKGFDKKSFRKEPTKKRNK